MASACPLALRFCGRERAPALLVFALAAGVFGASVAGAQRSSQFRSEVELVQLQVTVVDSAGEFVTGLLASDFVVVVDGEPRPAQIAYEVDLQRSAQERPVANAAAASDPERFFEPIAARRHLLLVFDLNFTTRRGIREARRAALELMADGLYPGDLIGVATINRFGVELLVPFTADRRQVTSAIARVGLTHATDGAGQNDVGTDIVDGDIPFPEYAALAADYLRGLERLGEMLQAIAGRKHLILLSSGIADKILIGDLEDMAQDAEARGVGSDGAGYVSLAGDPEENTGSSLVRGAIAETTEQLLRSDVLVHAVSVRRLDFRSGGRQSLQYLAAGTGGDAYWNYNDLTVPLRRIDEATSRYYVLGYRRAPSDGETVEIEVRALPIGVEVVSAPSRLSPPPDYSDMSETQRQVQLAEALGNDQLFGRMDLAVRAVPFPAPGSDSMSLLVSLELPPAEVARLQALRGEQALRLEIAAVARRDDGSTSAAVRRAIVLDRGFLEQEHEDRWFRYFDVMEVPPGLGRLRLLVRESAVGELTATSQRYDAAQPRTGELFVAPPIAVALHASMVPASDVSFDPLTYNGRRLTPLPRPWALPGERVQLLMVVYNLPQIPRAALGVTIELAVDGAEPRVGHDIEILHTDAEANATRLLVRFRVPESTPAGDARVWVRLTDPATGAHRDEQLSLRVGAL